MIKCHKCNKQFKSNQNLNYHLYKAVIKCDDKSIKSNKKSFDCKKCKESFSKLKYFKEHNLIKHINNIEITTEIEKCIDDKEQINNVEIVKQIETCIDNKEQINNVEIVKQIETCIDNKINTDIVSVIEQNNLTKLDESFMSKLKDELIIIIKEEVSKQLLTNKDTKIDIKDTKIDIKDNIINNGTINIHTYNVNNFGQENRDYINKNIYYKCFSSPGVYIPMLLKDLHFNPEHPENHNIIPVNNGEAFNIYNENKLTLYNINNFLQFILKSVLDTFIEYECEKDTVSDNDILKYRKLCKEKINKMFEPNACDNYKTRMVLTMPQFVKSFNITKKNKKIHLHYEIDNQLETI